jgi:PAS domain S-box-containing protein
LRDARGETRVIGTAVDVSEKMLAQAKLQRAQERAQTAINIGELGFAEWRANQGWVEVNARYRSLLGLESNELPDYLESYVKRVHADDREDFLRRTDEGLKTGRSKLGTHRYLRSDGTWVWIESAAHYDRDAFGKLQNVLVVARDLTHQKAVEQSLESNVERLTAAMEIGQIELFEHDMQSDAYTFTNGFLELVGWTSSAAMTEADLLNMVVPEDRLQFQSRLHADRRQVDAEQPLRFRIDTGFGLRCVEATTKYFFDANGKPLRSLGAIRDVTYQLMVEEEIRAQSTLFEALIENAPDIIVRIDRDAKIVLANQALKTLLGVDPLSVLGKTPEEIPFGPGRAAAFRERIERCFETREGGRFELQFHNIPDAPPLSVRYVPELGSNAEVRFVLVMLRDISELKQAEAEAIANARQLGQILETAEEGILVADPNDMIVFNNPKLEQIFGYDPNELLGKHEALFQIDDQDQTWRMRAADRKRGLSESYTVRFKRKDGSHVLCWVNAKPLSDESGKFSGTLAMITDVSELERTEAELRQAVEWLEFSMESAQIAGFDLDLDTGQARTTTLFREWFESSSVSESPLVTWMRNVHPDDHANIQSQVRQIMDRGSSSRLEFRIIDQHRAVRWIYGVIVMVRNVDGRVVRMVFTVVDVSERKALENERAQLQDQIARAQREESMGALAAGVAHDVNNLLTAAFGQVDMAKLALSDSERAESLGQIEDALSEMTTLSNQMLAYSGRNTLKSRVQDLNELLEKIRSILNVSVGKQVRFAIDLFPEKLPVLADESQLQQVVINLLINAQEAVDAHAKSHLKSVDWRPAVRLDTGRLPWQQCPPAIQKQLKPQRVYAFIQISDNGSGMDADTLKNASEPFFTTKGVGRGLGLSVVEGIVRSHSGALEIRSNPGGGTQCTVYFALEQRNPIAMPGQEAQIPQRGGLILVVDDESSLRSLISRTLNAQGFQTLTAGDGVQALQVLSEQPDVDLVLLDLTMPEKDGLAVFREIKQQQLPVRVVLMSGYSEHAVRQLGTENYPAPAFLAKPFRANELLSAVLEALAADDAS